jgi:hypothetical protein
MDNYKSIPALASYIDRVGAEQLNFRRFMVKEHKGHYYHERALIKISSDGTISCNVEEYAPTEEEVGAIKLAIASADWPKAIGASNVTKLLADELKFADRDDIFEFWDRKTNTIKMVQQRWEPEGKPKVYIPWTFFSDGKWRRMEPDGALPMWKPKEKRFKDRIMIHEGAKAARYVDWFLNDDSPDAKLIRELHPWTSELEDYEHWGMIGGALAPHRADYAEIAFEAPNEVVYVCDNDYPGNQALEVIAKCYGRSMKGIRFDQRWPGGWDLADEMPSAFFSKTGRYKGPTLWSLTQAATWATETKPNPSGKGRPLIIVSRAFREEWFHCVKPEVYIHKDWPNRIWSESQFNSLVAPYSDINDTATAFKKVDDAKGLVLKYDPGKASGIYGSSGEGHYINTHTPGDIEPEDGDVGPWETFLENLFPIEADRYHVKRWVATLIARPDVKVIWGMLLISETQGVGKTTLGEKILAPILGRHNVSYPTEGEISESQFNYWQAHKRLAIVNEIYAGQSAKAYNKLKSVITEKFITISRKFQDTYEIENWTHILACSNSMRALKLDNDDRRWFLPKVTEEKQTSQYWHNFNYWLEEEGGLAKIMGWARKWIEVNPPARTGEDAPTSTTKLLVIEETLSQGMTIVNQMMVDIETNAKGPVILLDTDLRDLIKNQLHNGREDSKLEKASTIRKHARNRQWSIGAERICYKEWGVERLGPRILAFVPDDQAHARRLADLKPSEIQALGLKPLDIKGNITM